ncbi:MAG: 3,4-dihydroxy-2-butanone-4-phosphate synthase, partial [Myxococcaceae bacterium]
RTGQTEGSVDLARLAGLFPAGVICEVMNPDGTMARRPELQRFARRHGLAMLSVADLIRYRLQNDRLVKRVAGSELRRPQQGTWMAYAYQSDVDSDVHIAMVKGDIGGPVPVLTRVHRACPVGDLLGSAGCDCGSQLEQAFKAIADAGRGVLVYLHKAVRPASALACTRREAEDAGPDRDRSRLREFGVGAQILKDLGLRRLRLLTNNPKKIVGLESYSLEVVEQIPLTRQKVQRRQGTAS